MKRIFGCLMLFATLGILSCSETELAEPASIEFKAKEGATLSAEHSELLQSRTMVTGRITFKAKEGAALGD